MTARQGVAPVSLEFLAEPALIVDADGMVQGANAAAHRQFGPALMGRALQSLFGDPAERLRRALADAAASTAPVMRALSPAPGGQPTGRRQVRVARLTADPGDPVLLVLHFAPETEARFRKLCDTVKELEALLRERAAEKAELRAALEQNQLLYNELQHRQKNNIHLIGVLLRMSAGDHGSPEVRNVMDAAMTRIEAMARTQEVIYEARGLGVVEAETFIQRILRGLSASLLARGRIDCNVQPLRLRAEAAHNLALIVNELATNALKYGRQDNTAVLEVRLVSVSGPDFADDTLEMSVADNGPGFDLTSVTRSSGLAMVEALVQQLDGTMRLQAPESGGADWRITLPADCCRDDEHSAPVAD